MRGGGGGGGGLTMSVLSGKDDTPTKFNIGDHISLQDNQMYDILEGTMTMPPTTLNILLR